MTGMQASSHRQAHARLANHRRPLACGIARIANPCPESMCLARSGAAAGRARPWPRLRGLTATGKSRASRAREPAVTAPRPPATSGLTSRDAGVDIDAGNEVVERIKPLVKLTM